MKKTFQLVRKKRITDVTFIFKEEGFEFYSHPIKFSEHLTVYDGNGLLKAPNIVVEWSALPLPVREGTGSNFDLKTVYPG
jgi:hypothetical protein